MTALELYKYALIEVNKLEAPSLLLEDYNYFINKAVQQYVNKVYNRYDLNQQSTDDLNVLIKRSFEITLSPLTNLLDESVYCGDLPEDYLHLLNCIVKIQPQAKSNCNNPESSLYFPARRLTSDLYSNLLTNTYLRPTHKRPYYCINRNETLKDESLNETLKDESLDKIQIKCGKKDALFTAEKIYIDYIASPSTIELTYDEIDSATDVSDELQFPNYVCYEIINEFVKLLMENASDPRLQTNVPINQTIAVPQQDTK